MKFLFSKYDSSYEAVVNKSLRLTGKDVNFFARIKADLLKTLLVRLGYLETGSPNRSLLDIGCGIGLMHPMLKDSFEKVTGIEEVAGCVDIARQNNTAVRYELASIFEFDPTENLSDVALATGVIHHILPDERGALLRKVHECLKIGGVFVIFEHHPYNPFTQIIVRSSSVDQFAHLIAPNDLIRLALDNGFKLVERGYLSLFPSSNRFLRWIEFKLKFVPLGAQYYLVLEKCKK